MKKLIVILSLLVLVVPFKGTSSQSTGEKVAVQEGIASREKPIGLLELLEVQPTAVYKSGGGEGRFYYTHPEFNSVMTTTVTSPANNTENGYLFVGAMGLPYDGPSALLILDNEGEPFYIKTHAGNGFLGDFKKQTVNGVEYLTYQADHLPDGTPYYYSVVMDENYQVVDTWTYEDGLADVHDLLLLDNGHAIVMAYVPQPFDLSHYGGPPDGVILDVVLQEQDANKNVVFEWVASEHMPIGDTDVDLNEEGVVDFLHTNAVEVDNDGNWLLSHRHFSEITKISRHTGNIIWRMGGKGNEFTFTNDIGFSRQHDIRRQENGNITIFDNGNYHVPPHSRAVEYAIDEVAKTVTRVWQYPNDMSQYAFAMGNHHRLPNGNSLIGWGTLGKLTEVANDGTVALEIQFGSWSYRAFRFPWSGTPLEAPRAAIQYGADPTAVTLYTSWNGATDITSYDVYAGPTMGSMSVVDTIARDGFETEINLTGLPADTCFFQTKPIDAQADPTPFSNMSFRVDIPACWDQLEHAFLPIGPGKPSN